MFHTHTDYKDIFHYFCARGNLHTNITWTIKAKEARRITAADMKYMKRTARYTWTDYRTNTQIAKELKITPILVKLLEYKRKCYNM